MPSTGWTPSTVPYGADQTVYLVVDRFGRLGSFYREIEVERTDLETIITDLMSGQFNDPVRVVAFNTLEHWSEEISKDIALEIQTRCDIDGVAVPEQNTDYSRCNVATGIAGVGDQQVEFAVAVHIRDGHTYWTLSAGVEDISTPSKGTVAVARTNSHSA